MRAARPAAPAWHQLELAATVGAPRAARQYLQRALAGTSCPRDDVDAAVLLASELVTNAVLHGDGPVVLQLRQQDGGLRVQVHDCGRAAVPAAPPPPSLTAEGGRGLSLVEALASSWGSLSGADGQPGNTVWFELVAPSTDG